MRAKFCDGLTRRDFMRIGAIGTAGGLSLGLSPWSTAAASEGAEGPPPIADSVLFLNLGGGPSHLDTLDMKPEAPAETRGEFQPIQSRIPGLTMCEHLPQLAQAIDRMTLIRGISHTSGAHPQGQSYISTGNRPTPAVIYPSLGSVAGKQRPTPDDIPPYVAIPATEWNSGYLGDAYAPFKTNDTPKPGQPFEVRGLSLAGGLTLEKVNRRQALLAKIDRTFRQAEANSQLLDALDKFGDQAHSMLTSPRSREAFDVSQESATIRERFTGDEFNQGVLLGCRLIKYGVRFVTVTYQGWDTHLENFKGHARLLPPLDNALPAALDMLSAEGLLDRTLVVAMGEFGRTPKINVNVGRDHYPRASWALMAGGGVAPGQLIGGTDPHGLGPDDATQIKPDDLVASIYHALGIHRNTEFYTRTGRPIMLVPQGRVMTELFG
ncbi:DUF1501 domain-containing protein [Lignipirellula cremea]|uniref:DUF1501 domain-containing protein n=1 Tax=Lignipirellula cremea TaxID=2528010 RepID=A0A518DR27_9BACT|nr:DUF1501 domain-containing protein [Lignipirellula cremea]QDU94298.1 hypothetical protein Pla8534_20870 [Lignipirellula cremea]